MDPAGTQESLEHSDCEGKQKGQRPPWPQLHMALMAGSFHPRHGILGPVAQLPTSVLREAPPAPIFTLSLASS